MYNNKNRIYVSVGFVKGIPVSAAVSEEFQALMEVAQIKINTVERIEIYRFDDLAAMEVHTALQAAITSKKSLVNCLSRACYNLAPVAAVYSS